MAKTAVTPQVLLWAREEAALERDEVASKIGITSERLADWEAGAEEPTTSAVREMARLYRRPLAVFFMADPPSSEDLPTDFRLRTVGGRPAVVTRDLVVAVRQTRSWRSLARQLAETNPGTVPQTRVLPAEIDQNPEGVGAAARGLLNIGFAQQRAWSDVDVAFGAWRQSVEKTGVLVFALKLSREICRGFSLGAREELPVIALASESPQARSFTLMHELSHLMLGSGGICTQFADDTDIGRVERFCNQVAAAVLLPEQLMRQTVAELFPDAGGIWFRDDVKALGDALHVSMDATALRLEDLNMAVSGLYDTLTAGAPPPYKREGGGGGSGSWPGTRIGERGDSFSALVYEAWQRKQITTGDAARVMNMRPKYVGKIGAALARRQQRFGA